MIETKGTLADALVSVIAAWRMCRHPRLAELAEILDERIAEETPRAPLGRSKKAADLEAWTKREAKRDPLDFRVLAAAAGSGMQDDVIAHVKALAKRDDPRTVAAMFALLEDPPYAGVRSRGMLRDILTAIESSGDARVPARARDLGGRYLAIVESGTGGWMVTELGKLAARMESLVTPQMPKTIADGCVALEARLGDALATRRSEAARHATDRKDDAALLAAVYAAPDDDAPRLVFADALIKRDDPRGELIMLQIARARGEATDLAREKELLDGHLADWAQPLSNAGSCTFERGFPSKIRFYSRMPKQDVLDSPAWATITSVRVPAPNEVKILDALAQVMDPGSLRPRTLAELAHRERAWTELVVLDAEELAELRFLPRLRKLALEVSGGALVPELLGTLHTPDALEELEISAPELPAGFLAPARGLRKLTLHVATLPAPAELPSLRELEILDPETRHVRGRKPSSPDALRALLATQPQLTRLAVDAERLAPGTLAPLVKLVSIDAPFATGADLPDAPLATARIAAPSVDNIDSIDAIVRRFPTLTMLTLEFGAQVAPHREVRPVERALAARGMAFESTEESRRNVIHVRPQEITAPVPRSAPVSVGDDDASRLAYARTLPDGDPRRDYIIAAIEGRPCEDLLAQHRKEWEAPLTELDVESVTWERGFPVEVEISADVFAQVAAELVAVAPTIRRLELRFYFAGAPRSDWARRSELARIRALTFTPAEDEDAQTIAACPHLGALEEVTLATSSNEDITNKTAKALAGVKTLRRLRLDGTQIGPTAVAALATLRLEMLELRGSPIGDRGAAALARMKTLRRLQLSRCEIGPAGARALAALPLEELDLGYNPIGDAGAIALAATKTLRSLRLSSTEIGDPGIAALAGIETIRSLDIGSNKLAAVGVKALVAAAPRLTSLDVSWCKPGGAATRALRKAFGDRLRD